MKLTKNQKSVADKVEAGKMYTLKEASELVKEITTTKFDASLDIDVRLGVDPRKANQMVRGVVSLPNGTGKVTRVLALCTPDQEAAAKEAGADYVGLDEYIEKIKGGWTDIDVIITMPSCMGKIGPIGRILGPRGLMPNPKSGTVTMDVAKAVKEVKQGKIDFKVDKASLDIDVRLGVDPRKANQMVRGVVSLPNGTGKVTRVLALCTPDQEAAAKEAGADYVGLDEYIEKIKGGWTDIDVIITMPSCMGKIGPIGRILGPRGLMPNPKSGTVTMDVAKAVKEVKQGKIDFKVDKAGIIHTSIGKVSFTPEAIYQNAKEFIATIIKLKPAAAKGTYIKSIFISSTMSKGIKVDPKSVE